MTINTEDLQDVVCGVSRGRNMVDSINALNVVALELVSAVEEGGGGGGAVASVNGQTGAVELQTDDIPESGALFHTTERAQDAAAALFVDGTHSGISFTYDDATGKINAAVSGGAASDVWPINALQAIAQAATRRIDFVMIGDSNQQMDGYGFDGSFNTKLTARFGMYATPIYGGFDGQSQGGTNCTGGGSIGVATGAPAALEPFSIGGKRYGYVATGTFNVGNNGVRIENVTGVNTNANWRFHYAYGTFDSGSGSFRLGIRRGDSPFTTLLNGVVTSTNTGAFTYQKAALDLPAAVRNHPVEFKWFNNGGTVITAPFLGYWCRAENLDLLSGVSCHTLYGAGGESLWDFNNALEGIGAALLTNYFAIIREGQISKGFKPIVVFYINSGLNDRNETSTPSWGWRASTTADSPTAFIDNMEALTKRIEDIWQRNDWDPTEIFFLFMPSHPISLPDDTELVSYRKCAQSLAAKQRCSYVDITNLINHDTILANGWYKSSGADKLHLTTAGYDGITDLVLALI